MTSVTPPGFPISVFPTTSPLPDSSTDVPPNVTTLPPLTSPTPSPSPSTTTSSTSTTSTTSSPSSSVTVSPVGAASKSSGVPAGAIAGAVIGVLALLALLGLALFFLRRRRRRATQGSDHVLPTRRVSQPPPSPSRYTEPKPRDSSRRVPSHAHRSSSLGTLTGTDAHGKSEGTLAGHDDYAAEKDVDAPTHGLPGVSYTGGEPASLETTETLSGVEEEFRPPALPTEPSRSRSIGSATTVGDPHYGTAALGPPRAPSSAAARLSAQSVTSPSSLMSPVYGLHGTYPPVPAQASAHATPRTSLGSRPASREDMQDGAGVSGRSGSQRKMGRKPVPAYPSAPAAVPRGPASPGPASPTSTEGPSSPPGLRGLGGARSMSGGEPQDYMGVRELAGGNGRPIHYLIPDPPMERRY